MGIYEKLLKVQTEVKVPKSQYNDFGNFNYRTCEDIQNAVKPLLKEVNAVLRISDEIVMIGTRYYVKATAILIDCETGEHIENVAYAREDESKPKMDASQLTGSTSSYARKYALNGLFCLDDVKDADSGKNGNKGRNEAQNSNRDTQNQNRGQNRNNRGNKLEKKKYNDILEELKRTGYRTAEIIKKYKIRSLWELNDNDYDEVMRSLKNIPNRGNTQRENREEIPRAATFQELMNMFPPDDEVGPFD